MEDFDAGRLPDDPVPGDDLAANAIAVAAAADGAAHPAANPAAPRKKKKSGRLQGAKPAEGPPLPSKKRKKQHPPQPAPHSVGSRLVFINVLC